MFGRRSFLRAAGIAAAGSAIGQGAARRAAADCTGATVGDGALSRLRSRIAGEVILPGDASYPSARLVQNLRFDPRPVAIIRAAGESDVARAIEFSRANGIRLAVRSGGHSFIGASGGDGIILDLSLLNGVAALGGSAFRIGSGTQLQHVYGELRCNGGWTVPSGSCDTVGFGGIALGGGFGYLQREHGLTCDRVLAARVVLADGSAVDASDEGDSDLYWAIRGGAAGFGVVTHFDVEAVPFRTIRVVGWYWPLAASDDALQHFHSISASGLLPRNCTAALVFNGSSASMTPSHCLGLVFCTGTASEADAAVALFVGPGGVRKSPGFGFAYDSPSPACDPSAPFVQSYFRAKSSMVFAAPAPDTGSQIAQRILERNADARFSSADYGSVSILTLGGAVGDRAPDATAFRHRNAQLEVQFYAALQQRSAMNIAANDEWLRGTYDAISPRLSSGGSGGYVSYADDELPDDVWPVHYWGLNYSRLQVTKRRVDPTDFFRGRQTVRP
jgi:hypothetical protein